MLKPDNVTFTQKQPLWAKVKKVNIKILVYASIVQKRTVIQSSVSKLTKHGLFDNNIYLKFSNISYHQPP